MFAAERVSHGAGAVGVGCPGRLKGAGTGPAGSTGSGRAAVCLKNENSPQADIGTQFRVLPLDCGWWVHVIKH